MTNLPTPEAVRFAFEYDRVSGSLVWAHSRGRASKGSQAGSVQLKGGKQYLTVQMGGKRFGAHRVVWAHVHGAWPVGEVDHIDGDGLNNRIENLREVSSSGNKQNLRAAKSHSATGLLGAFRWRNKFKAQIVVNGKCKHIGTFETPEEAHAAYVQAKRLYHPMGTL